MPTLRPWHVENLCDLLPRLTGSELVEPIAVLLTGSSAKWLSSESERRGNPYPGDRE
jgi:hypothetical protein